MLSCVTAVESRCGKLLQPLYGGVSALLSCLPTSSDNKQVLHSNASSVLCSTAEVCVTAVSCGVSMWRVDWEEEAVEARARKQSIAIQAETLRLLQSSSRDARDVENSLDGVPQGSCRPGRFCHRTCHRACHWVATRLAIEPAICGLCHSRCVYCTVLQCTAC